MTRSCHRRSLFVAVAALLLLAPVLSLTRPAAAQDRPTLRFGVNAADLSTLDPHYASGTQDRTVVDMIFNGLVRFKPGDASQMEPDLATEIPEPVMEGEAQTWTFTLREGVMCHPWEGGEAYPLSADDVVYSLQKAANPDSSGYSADYAGMTVEKVDDLTVKITMATPLSSTLFLPKVANYNGGFIVCSRAVEALGLDGFKTVPVGTGPFVFDGYTPQTSVNLVANDDYFRGAPQLGGVEIRYMPDATSRELALQSGELDAAAGLSEAQWVTRINDEGTLQADIFGVGEAAFVNLNVENEYLSNPMVRQAIAYAINREEHQALYGSPVSEIIYSVVPAQLLPGGLTQEQAAAAGVDYAHDLEKAKQLMIDAGYPDGFSLTLVTSEMPAYRANYEVLESELSQIGIEIELQVVDHATMHAQIREDVNPIVIYVVFRPNADVLLTQFFHSNSIVVTGESPVTNFSHYTAIDGLIEEARAATDPAQQEELWRQANTQILTDVAAVPLQYQNQVYARNPNVDYGHELKSVLALYPGIDETTTIAAS
jgi:peptide/nickel transport system substrate-binding protein